MRISIFVTFIFLAGVSWLFSDSADDQFNFATGLFIRNEAKMAAEEFEKLLTKHPDYKEIDVVLFRLGEAYHKAGDLVYARKSLERLLKEHPKSERVVQAHYLLGQILSSTEYVEAAKHFGAVSAMDAKGTLAESAMFGEAEALYAAKEWQAATKAYKKILECFPAGKYKAQALYSSGWAYFMDNDFTNAVSSFESFIQQFNHHELVNECRLKLADSLLKIKKFAEALKTYETIDSEEKNLKVESTLGRAWCFHELQQYAKAMEAFEQAALLIGDDARAAIAFYNAGNAAFAGKIFDKSANFFKKISDKWPQHELAHLAVYWQSLALQRNGQLDEAIGLLNKFSANKLEPNLAVDALLLMAEIKMSKSDYTEAAELYGKIAKEYSSSPKAGDAAIRQAVALEKKGDLVNAARLAADFATKYGKHAEAATAAYLAGDYEFRRGEFIAAKSAFEKYIKTYPDHQFQAEAHFKLGICAFNINEFEVAEVSFKDVAQRYPENLLAPEALFMAGRTAESRKDVESARKYFSAAANLKVVDSDIPPKAALEIIRLDLKSKRYDEALAKAREFGKKYEGVVGDLTNYAKLYEGESLFELQRYDEALTMYTSIKPSDDVSFKKAALNGQAWTLRKSGKHKEATVIFLQLFDLDATNGAQSLFWAARSFEDASDFDKAFRHFSKFVEAFKDDELIPEALYRQATCATRNGNATEAEQIYKSWLQKYRNETLRPSVLYGLAWVQLEKNKQEEARANFEILVHDYPDDSLSFDSYFRIGEIAYNKEQYGEAAVAYEKALKDKGDLELDKVIYKLGWAQEKTGNIEKALGSFNKLTAEYPESPLASEAYYRQGRILQELKRLAEAAVSYAAVKDGKFFERAVFGEAEVQRLLGNHKTALAGYDKLLQEWPKGEMKIPGMLGRGHAMLAIGANQNAVEAYEQVVRETDTIEAAEALLGVGKAYMAMEKWEDAAKAFLKIDILYGYDELKPQALDHLVKVWEMAGNKEKADKYRKERQQRYPN